MILDKVKDKFGLQLEYKSQKDLRLYDPNDKENTIYIYWDWRLRGTRLYGDKRLYTLDRLLIYADTVPMISLKEFQDRYTVSFTYLYGKKKELTTAYGRIVDLITGSLPPELPRGYGRLERKPLLELPSHELSPSDRMWIRSFMAYDNRGYAKIWWEKIESDGNPRGGGNIPPSWVDLNELKFIEKT